jgi:hypothetical protein
MSPDVFDEVSDLAQSEGSTAFNALSNQLGVNGAYSDSLMQALATPAPLAVVEVINATNSQEVESKNIFIFSSGDINWLMQPEDSGLVILSTPVSEAFAREVQSYLTELTIR